MDTDDTPRVGDVMSSPLRTISPDATVEAAATEMREHDISALLVTSRSRSIVSSTDILDVVADGRDPAEVTVADVMTEAVETVTPDLFLEEAAAMMETFGIKHLPVVEDDYVGMLSTTDLAEHFS